MNVRGLVPLLATVGLLAACHPSYSPDDYATNAVQQANKVDQGVVVGYRQIVIRPDGTTGTVTGGAAGGIVGGAAGSQSTMATALGAVGGTLVGGLIGSGVEKATGNTEAFEYIIRKGDGSLMSVVQKDEKPINIGQRVLLIAGNQARIVPDYTVTIAEPAPAPQAQPAQTQGHAPVSQGAAAPTVSTSVAPSSSTTTSVAPTSSAAEQPTEVAPSGSTSAATGTSSAPVKDQMDQPAAGTQVQTATPAAGQ